MGDPPVFLFTVAEWQARDKMKLGEAEILFGKRERGIRLVNKPTIQERELGSGLATIEQVEGLPVAGPAIRLFYGKKKAA